MRKISTCLERYPVAGRRAQTLPAPNPARPIPNRSGETSANESWLDDFESGFQTRSGLRDGCASPNFFRLPVRPCGVILTYKTSGKNNPLNFSARTSHYFFAFPRIYFAIPIFYLPSSGRFESQRQLEK